MTRLDIERKEGFPWWLIALIALVLVALVWFIIAQQPAELSDRDQSPAVTSEDANLSLDTVIQETDLPRQFTYGGLTWQATGAGRYEQDGLDLIAVGPRIEGNELYYEQGTPTNPYQVLYLRGEAENYRNVYVRYEPVQQ